MNQKLFTIFAILVFVGLAYVSSIAAEKWDPMNCPDNLSVRNCEACCIQTGRTPSYRMGKCKCIGAPPS